MRVFVILLLCIGFSWQVVSSDLAPFHSWLHDHGISNDKVYFQLGSSAEWIARASGNIQVQEEIASVPFDLLISERTVIDSDIGFVFKDVPDANPTIKLAVFLMHQRSLPASKWIHYLDTLPASFDTPIYWSKDELEELRGTQLLAYTEQRLAELKDDYHRLFETILFKLYPGLFSPSAFTFDDFKWACSVLWSRCFLFQLDADTVPVLVPFLDLFPHAKAQTSFEVDEAKQRIVLRALAPITKDQLVQADIGSKSNAHLLFNMGFTLDENPNDAVPISFIVTTDDPFSATRARILEARGLPAGNHTYTLHRDTIAEGMLSAIRIHMMKPSEYDTYPQAFEGKPISLTNELAVYRQLLAACSQLLKQYPTTAEADAELLKEQLPRRRRTAVSLRHSEKTILIRTMELTATHWSSFLLNGVP